MIAAKVVADSFYIDARLTSFELVYPRFIHSELMTYCMWARNSASSRAIPIAKMIAAIEADPAMPVSWGKNQKGMSADEELSPENKDIAKAVWLHAMRNATTASRHLADIGVHKQIANRLTEPFMHMQTVVTATEFANMYHQRTARDAQPEFQALAEAMLEAHNKSRPVELWEGGGGFPQWHLPYVSISEAAGLGPWNAQVVSVARCARASYTNQGKAHTLDEDIALYNSLVERGHWSPLEHIARACHWNSTDDVHSFGSSRPKSGKFRRFLQLRHWYGGENVTKFERLLDPRRPPDVD